jgi:Complex I intermediate-associated protein 30 (CIA30)
MAMGLDQARASISNAISMGAPAYNSGKVNECVAIYESTAQQILQMPAISSGSSGSDLPKELQTSLQETLDAVAASNDDSVDASVTAAWALRRAFDAILEYSPCYLPQCADCLDVQLEPFVTGTQVPSQPIIVNDSVMGGISNCQWIPEQSTMTGTTSLANNGGFSSLRWRFPVVQNWSYAKGIYLKVKHYHQDHPSKTTTKGNRSHTFRLLLKDFTSEQMARGANYKVVFCNPTNSGDPILIPFADFNLLELRGRTLGNSPIHTSSITELGIMAIKPSVVGDFELVINEWGLYY